MSENNLMLFEGNSVIIETINGEPHFEIYSTGVALGYYKTNSIGKNYPRKERIDSTIKNAEIAPCVRGVHKYFSESQLYDFMLEAKTEKCKPFRKWIVTEVLPSIRKTGSYSVSPQPKLAEPKQKSPFNIESIPKDAYLRFYNRPCITIRGICEAANCPTGTIKYIVKAVLEKEEFKTLRNTTLQTFKRKNPQHKIGAGQVTIIFKNGLDKIAFLLNSESTATYAERLLEYKAAEQLAITESKPFQLTMSEISAETRKLIESPNRSLMDTILIKINGLDEKLEKLLALKGGGIR